MVLAIDVFSPKVHDSILETSLTHQATLHFDEEEKTKRTIQWMLKRDSFPFFTHRRRLTIN